MLSTLLFFCTCIWWLHAWGVFRGDGFLFYMQFFSLYFLLLFRIPFFASSFFLTDKNSQILLMVIAPHHLIGSKDLGLIWLVFSVAWTRLLFMNPTVWLMIDNNVVFFSCVCFSLNWMCRKSIYRNRWRNPTTRFCPCRRLLNQNHRQLKQQTNQY